MILTTESRILHDMKERNVLRIIIPLLLLSLLGLIALQVELLRSVYDQKEVAFDNNAINALHSVARSLETREVQSKVLRMMGDVPPSRRVIVSAKTDSANDGTYVKPDHGGALRLEFHPQAHVIDSICISNDTITFTRKLADAPRTMKTVVSDTIIDGRYPAPLIRRRSLTSESGRGRNADDSLWYFTQQFEEFLDPAIPREASPLRRRELMAQAMDVVYINAGAPIKHTITVTLLDSLIRADLLESGIDLTYAFGIAGESADSMRLVSSPSHYNELKESKLAAGLFTGDLMGGINRLVLFFPGRSLFILRQMASSLAATALFVFIILGSFAYTIRTIFREKRFHTLLTDFINNMTHEFKTPLSTISVVTDTLTLPNVVGEREKVLHYNGIIRDEIGRMKVHVDKILQMAVLEEGDYELKQTDADIHPIIGDATEKIRLRVEQRGGSLLCELLAPRHIVRCDPFHVSNIIFNLLDNAEKYSPAQPDLLVRTENAGEEIVISVRDRGIGIPEQDQQYVFDRYYRVSTGNRHDVKGFGLGLSYVKLMVGAHHGTIRLTSVPGAGTTVTMNFPTVG